MQKINHEITDKELLLLAHKIDALVKKSDIHGVIILQGTNAIEEVAWFLNPQQARILLRVSLSATNDTKEIQRIFNQY